MSQPLPRPADPTPNWSTSMPDWEARILNGRSLVPDLPLYRDEAERGLRVFKRLRVPDLIGTPTLAEACGPWFLEIAAALFGAYDPATHIRRIQEFFLCIPKKNSKSSYGGALMLAALIMNRRPEAEFNLIAPTITIAQIAFDQAEKTIKLDPELDKLFQTRGHIRTIEHRVSGAKLAIKAADTDVITGGKSVGTMIDETHVFAAKSKAAAIFVELRGALTARPDGFLFQTTTQSKEPPSGVFAAELKTARAVRDGTLDLPLLPVIYEYPRAMLKERRWRDRTTWHIVNPNLGRSVREDFLARELERAELEGVAQLALVASQHLNVEIGVGLSTDGWAGADHWIRGAAPELTLEDLLARSEVVTIGIDGGGLDDLLGLAVIGRERETRAWLAWAHALISPEGLERRKANRPKYDGFIADGDLTVVEALPDDLAWIRDTVERIKDTGLLAKVGADPAGLGGIVDVLAEIEVTEDADLLTGVPQGIRLMNAAKTVERKLVDGSFRHPGSRLLAWCAGNAKVRATSTAMLIERAASGYGKIDPLMALFNAAHLMSFNPIVAPALSVPEGYEVPVA